MKDGTLAEGARLEPDPGLARKPGRFGIGMVLIIGFGGLIAIMAAAGIFSLRIAEEIQLTSTQLRTGFLSRERVLEQIRSDFLESGNIARDYVLAGADQATATSLRADLQKVHDKMESELRGYSNSLRAAEAPQFDKLRRELDDYWSTLNPIFERGANKNRDADYSYLRNEILSRRSTLLAVADEIGEVNRQALADDEARIADTFFRFQRRLRIITALGLSLSLALAVFTGFHILHLEKVSDARYKQTLSARNELQRLSARLVDAQESERREISRELHDEVGQSLTALLMEIDKLAAPDNPTMATFRPSLENLKLSAEGTLNVVRDMSLLLRPSMLDDLGLVPALEWQAREVSRRTGLSVSVAEKDVSDALSEEFKTCIYRVVQEALNNCAKHARANRVEIIVRQEPSRLVLSIQDDGVGFDAQRIRGLGLIGVSERINRLQGTLTIESKDGQGTTLRAELPLPESVATTIRGDA